MLRIVFMGTAELACPSLEALARFPQFHIVAAVTQPDKPKGRDLKLAPSPLKTCALRLEIPVLQPERARNESFVRQLSELRPDLIVVAAYGQILPLPILELPRHGCLNVHTSLLPKYRGAAPIQWAILNDERETGVTIMKMDAGLDTGDILTQRSTPITASDNAKTLHDRLAKIGSELLLATIADYVGGKVQPRPQPAEGATYARKITRQDGQLDWTQPARAVRNRVRALTPWPGAFAWQPAQPQPRRLKILEAIVDERASSIPGEILQADKAGIVVACSEKSLRILKLQREGGRALTAQEFLAGHELKPGGKLAMTNLE